MLQLNPSMTVKTPNGEATAILVINHGPQLPLEWLVINNATKEFESWRTQDIKYYVEPSAPSWLDSSPPAAPTSSTTVQSQTLVI
jgi:hypothetical protein